MESTRLLERAASTYEQERRPESEELVRMREQHKNQMIENIRLILNTSINPARLDGHEIMGLEHGIFYMDGVEIKGVFADSGQIVPGTLEVTVPPQSVSHRIDSLWDLGRIISDIRK